jgi:hypothetical protein
VWRLRGMRITSSEPQIKASEPGPKLRHEFVGMMFAVAIGEVGLQTGILVQASNWRHFLPAYSHLLLATVVIATSWVGWTLSPSPGARRDVNKVLELEFLVLLLDVLLVVIYFILARSVDFAGETRIQLNASAAPESFWILVIFGAYLVWDFLTKVAQYLKDRRSEPWFYNYGVRIVPTLICLILAYFTRRLIEKADPPHVLTADLALIALVLFFRALKDLVSALFPKPEVHKDTVRSRKYWAIAWSVLFGLGILLGILWTRSWPIPRGIAAEIQKAPLPESSHSETATPIQHPERPNVEHQ